MDFRIKGLEGQFINIQVIGYSYPHRNDFWDGNWLICEVRAEIPGFNVKFPTDLRTDEITSFYDQLVQMYSKMSGSSSLIGLESNVDIQVRMDKLGKLEWQVKLTFPSGYGASLEFQIHSEQSYLIKLIDEIKDIIKNFPIKGK
ncbi:hypothetical protein GC093_06760 [Paenibacillus sp. LMG 31456]|uniref:Uncharacterized protein n=1 Tax=Paenibacillus foliorum TaxID=2654974 RepID=A0A972JZN4_9BACL|nr:hypothetical protein [Paenibacillus foliorum]NOU92935.1 hypothetical protein [Paenibacillus foliorum]